MINIDLTGKIFLVTGSSRGLGAETISRICKAGAVGAVNYFEDPDGKNLKDAQNVVAKITSEGGNASAYSANISDPQQVQQMIQKIVADHGRLDGIVNNAGILRDRSMKKMSIEEWQSVIDTNLSGTFYGCKYAGEVLSDGGRIVNISSISGLMGWFGQANYASAKAGVIGLTKVAARELAKRNITVNAIAPGLIETDMFFEIPEEIRTQMLTNIPLGKFGKPGNIADAVLFLCSDLAAYITGQTISVNGGWYV